MKHLFFLFLLLISAFGYAQNIDSLLAQPQSIELTISTPQPRLNETFQVSIDIDHIKANLFKSLIGKVEIANAPSYGNDRQLTINAKALKKGINEIGPLVFTLDKTTYTTNKITYEVIDPLPVTNEGIWFRKVNISDNMFCIIIEQRIPAYEQTKRSKNTISFTTEPQQQEIVKFKSSYSIPGLSSQGSHSNTGFSSIEINGEEKQFMESYSVYYFSIDDKSAKISITKDKLENFPKGYRFEEIVVQ